VKTGYINQKKPHIYERLFFDLKVSPNGLSSGQASRLKIIAKKTSRKASQGN